MNKSLVIAFEAQKNSVVPISLALAEAFPNLEWSREEVEM